MTVPAKPQVDLAVLREMIDVLSAAPSRGRRRALAALLATYPEAAFLLRRAS